MNVVTVNEDTTEIFSKVLIEASEWLSSIGQLMWKASDLSVEELLNKYSLEEMKLCYDNNNLIGVYVIQWYDPRKLIQSAELLCKERNIEWLRLNYGTFRPRLRKFYENSEFKMLDRVFIDNRDQIRYLKKLL